MLTHDRANHETILTHIAVVVGATRENLDVRSRGHNRRAKQRLCVVSGYIGTQATPSDNSRSTFEI